MKKILINKTPGNWKNEIYDALFHVYGNFPILDNCFITLEKTESGQIFYLFSIGLKDKNNPEYIDTNLASSAQTQEQGHISQKNRIRLNIEPNDKIYLNCPDDHEF